MKENAEKQFPRIPDIEELRWNCPESDFDFETTEELKPLDTIVGQPRAVDAITLGVNLHASGYNIFVTGISGTGRTTTVKKIVEKNIIDNRVESPKYDFCFVNNFKEENKPRLIRLLQGNGKILKKSMEAAVNFLQERLPKLFDSDSFQAGRKNIVDTYKQEEKQIIDKFDKRIEAEGLVRGQLETGKGVVRPDIFIKREDKVYRVEDLGELVEDKTITKEEADKYSELYEKYRDELRDFMRAGMKMARQMQKELVEHDRNTAAELVNAAFEEIEETFDIESLKIYLEEARNMILDNLNIFVLSPASGENEKDIRRKKEDFFRLFTVNVVLDSSEDPKHPVIIETNPSYSNLFGTIETDYDPRGFRRTDFTKIRGGSLLKADQGFLLVNANDLFAEPGVWQALKRVMLYDRLEIQPYDSYFQLSQSAVKPEKIRIKVKVIIIGGMSLYSMLYNYEKGFKKMFKVLAQFDEATVRTEDIAESFPHFVSLISSGECCLHMDKSGVAALMEWAAEYAGSKNKISLRFSDISDVIRESSHYARLEDEQIVTRKHVLKAIDGRRFRYGLLDEKISRALKEESIFIDTEGERVGQINGLSVYSTGLFSFGKPARITAAIAIGNKGIVNIEREAGMSGNIHNKGVMIITGFLFERFGSKTPMSITASIAFEQNYGGIDGDSASAAEIYVLLSALTDIPIRQDLAITGSMNQKGDIQPIGGVNEKITGFYELCKERGFTGNQGVVIPEQNVKDLMLRHDIIDDIKAGNFTVHSIKKIEDGIPLFFGIDAGDADESGTYPVDTLFGKVLTKIKQLKQAGRPPQTKRKQKQRKESLRRIRKSRC